VLWNNHVPLVKISPGSVLLAVCLLAAGAGAQCAAGSAGCAKPAKTLLAAVNFAAADSSIAKPATEGAAASASVSPVTGTPVTGITPLIKPVLKAPQISHRDVQIWRGLTVMQHSAAVFDAWSTRKSLANGGYERDPLMRPFASNGSIYAMTQVTPLAFDFLSRRMLRSNNSLVRRFWWVPQTAFTAGSVWCGVRNLHVAAMR
jgi:hypothetical protein